MFINMLPTPYRQVYRSPKFKVTPSLKQLLENRYSQKIPSYGPDNKLNLITKVRLHTKLTDITNFATTDTACYVTAWHFILSGHSR